jgi:predicted oxidoreductase
MFNLCRKITFYMDTIKIGTSPLVTSRLAYGCWRIAGWDVKAFTPEKEAEGKRAVIAAYEAGYTLFDHANIYGGGYAEIIFGKVLHEISGMRDRVVITSKCGVRRKDDPEKGLPARWDFSGEHIVEACEASLQRLKIETLDILMLHRPDYLANPEEIAQAFSQLHAAGKVRFFGVSNFRPSLVAALQAACSLPLIVHQVEISVAKLDTLTDGTLDQCLESKMTPMAWSPLAGGQLGDGAKRLLPFQTNYRIAEITAELDTIARERGVSRTAVALAWLLKHPSGIVPIIGSTDPGRIRDAVKSLEIELTRGEWYRLLAASQGVPLP